MKTGDNAKSCAGTTKCQRIGGSPKSGDKNIKRVVRRDKIEVRDAREGIRLFQGQKVEIKLVSKQTCVRNKKSGIAHKKTKKPG